MHLNELKSRIPKTSLQIKRLEESLKYIGVEVEFEGIIDDVTSEGIFLKSLDELIIHYNKEEFYNVLLNRFMMNDHVSLICKVISINILDKNASEDEYILQLVKITRL